MSRHIYAIQYRKFGRWNTYSKRFTERDAALKAFVRIARSGQFEKVLLKAAAIDDGGTPTEWSVLCDEAVLSKRSKSVEPSLEPDIDAADHGFFGALGEAVAEAEAEAPQTGGALIVDARERVERLAMLAGILVLLGFGLGMPLLLLYGATAALVAAIDFATQRGDRVIGPYANRFGLLIAGLPFRVRQSAVALLALAALIGVELRDGRDPFINAAIDLPGGGTPLTLSVPQLVTCIERFDQNGVRYKGTVRIERDGLYRSIAASNPPHSYRFNFRLREGRAILESVELNGRREISTPERQRALLHFLGPCTQTKPSAGGAKG